MQTQIAPVTAAEQLQHQLWSLVRAAVERQRREHGLNQSAIARRLGVPRGLVCYWLARPERMTLKAAARLLAAIDCRLDLRLVTGESEPTRAA